MDRDRQPSSPKLILHSVPSRVPQTFFDLLQHPEGTQGMLTIVAGRPRCTLILGLRVVAVE